jgi:Protein of unknown function (DUF3313)
MNQNRFEKFRIACTYLLIVITISLGACALPLAPRSEFMSNLVILKASEFENVALYREPGFDPADYETRRVAPALMLAPAERLRDLAQVQQQEILAAIDNEIALRFIPRLKGETSNNLKVLIIQAVLTDVQTPNRALNVFSTFFLMPISSGGASLELEVIDEHSRILKFAATCSERGSVFRQFIGAFSLLAHSKHAISECVRRIGLAYASTRL